MFKRTMMVVFAMLVVMAAGSASAQCTVGVYADANGTMNTFQPTQGQVFHVYVVLFTENALNAVSYAIDIPGLGTDLLLGGAIGFGPSGNGFNVHEATGENVGLGECAIGFSGLPVVVADYPLVFLIPGAARNVTVLPNISVDPTFAQVNTCANQLITCDLGPSLMVDAPVANESTSFGAVKSLY